ncbi:hypothetical protein [Massilia sp. H6]|uniref:hypothetical protein n=1 Tax=Massilia sp. H6 TaxID=2970464 RepID=UPI0021693AB9|nr:hypothetical protein [Massilia sp. H6]UVW29435.1 hypothetical protein NRS07_04705 [Massilia sp. H6]
MSQFDPTGPESATDERPAASAGAELTYEEISGLSNGELGLADLSAAASAAAGSAPASTAPEILPQVGAPISGLHLPGIRKAVSGCYAGSAGAFQVELRVDIDRTRPMKRISGDFFQRTGKTLSYVGSFVVDAPVVTASASQYVVKGKGRFTFASSAPTVQVTVPRVQLFQPQAAATLQFFTAANAPGATYHCSFQSGYFRTVRIETDSVSDLGTPLLSSYDTGTLPSGGSGRSLGVVSAFAEAGIAMAPTAGGNVIDVSDAGGDASWSDAELHASMQRHFSLWADLPQWCVWQVAAQLHDEGPLLYGIMFDLAGKERQGCAVFHAGIGGSSADKQREQLYTYVHELGHCFNLLHSWQKHLASPPATSRPESLSWMNYPWKYPKGGAAGYWSNFDFRFDDEELIHLRHGFRNDIIMGGGGFGAGAALGRDILADPIEDESGLRLDISTHQNSFALGEPVVLELRLRATDTRGRRAHTWLHPNHGLVHIVISKPGGAVVAYEPLIDHLVGDRQSVLGADDTIQESAYIGFGKGGFYFEQPGQYRVRAAYSALDGSQVLSDILTVRVRYPVSPADDTLADLFMGDDQGALLYLLGSDSQSLRSGNAAFDEVLDRYGEHPLANYARLVKGVNAARTFKTIRAHDPTRIDVRGARPEESVALLSTAAEARVLDPVTTGTALQCLATSQARIGDEDGARSTLQTYSALSIKRP